MKVKDLIKIIGAGFFDKFNPKKNELWQDWHGSRQ